MKRSGKQTKRSLKTTDSQLAKRRLREFEEKLDRMDPAKGKVKITFKELAQRWLKIQKPLIKPSSHL